MCNVCICMYMYSFSLVTLFWLLQMFVFGYIVHSCSFIALFFRCLFVLCGKNIKVYSVNSGECMHYLTGHYDDVTGALVNPKNHLQVGKLNTTDSQRESTTVHVPWGVGWGAVVVVLVGYLTQIPFPSPPPPYKTERDINPTNKRIDVPPPHQDK